MIHQKGDGRAYPLYIFASFLSFLDKFLIELDQEQRLVLHVRKQVVRADEVKNIGSSEAQHVWERLPWLTVGDKSSRTSRFAIMKC